MPSGLRGNYGPPADDPLAARLLPGLPSDVRWGLDRMERILAALGDPHLDYPVLHVAGTNGKGSVAKVWAEVLTAAGRRTATGGQVVLERARRAERVVVTPLRHVRRVRAGDSVLDFHVRA